MIKAIAIFVVAGRDANDNILSTKLYTVKVPSSSTTVIINISDLNLAGVTNLEAAFSVQFGNNSGGFAVKQSFPYP
jgi:hypothetical protein